MQEIFEHIRRQNKLCWSNYFVFTIKIWNHFKRRQLSENAFGSAIWAKKLNGCLTNLNIWKVLLNIGISSKRYDPNYFEWLVIGERSKIIIKTNQVGVNK